MRIEAVQARLVCDYCAGDTPDVVGVVQFDKPPTFHCGCGMCGAIWRPGGAS